MTVVSVAAGAGAGWDAGFSAVVRVRESAAMAGSANMPVAIMTSAPERISAMRRSRGQAPPSGPAPYRGTHLFVDFEAISIRVDHVAVTLTRREFELLRFLIENRNRVISRDRLLERVWGFDLEIETRSVDVHVSRLRAKLATAGKQIETVIGMGYRFSDLAES